MANGGDDWLRIEAPAAKIPRIGAEFLERELRSLGESVHPPTNQGLSPQGTAVI